MGGKGSGGRRAGTGPKPKSSHLRGIDGGASHASSPAAAEPAGTAPIERFPAPSDLFNEDLLTWEALAPLAFAARTLMPATAYAFSLLCRNIVLERKLATSDAHAGGANHRGIVQRIDAELLAFNLRPNGKALYEAAKAAEPIKTGLRRFLP